MINPSKPTCNAVLNIITGRKNILIQGLNLFPAILRCDNTILN